MIFKSVRFGNIQYFTVYYCISLLLLPLLATAENRMIPRLGSLFQPEYIDLGYDFIEGETIFYPGQRFDYTLYQDAKGFNFTIPEHVSYFFASFSFCMGEHGGTHVDAPYHFNEFGWKLGEIPVDRLVNVPAVVIDLESDTFTAPNPQDFKVEVKHLIEHERKFGPISFGSVVLIHTGWARFWPDQIGFFGIRPDGSKNFPGVSGEAARWLVRERKIVGVGIDTGSIDVGTANPVGHFDAHFTFCGNNVYIIESLANTGRLLEHIRSRNNLFSVHNINDKCDLRVIVLPMKSKGTGGPARVVAYCA